MRRTKFQVQTIVKRDRVEIRGQETLGGVNIGEPIVLKTFPTMRAFLVWRDMGASNER
jgi:hypothetical protein